MYAIWGDYIAPVITQHFPREMLLTNKDGDDISITLISRDEKNVYFRKKGSPRVHSYEIAQLNFRSRCIIKLYPKSSPIPPPPPPKEIPDVADNPAQQHLNSMYNKREDLKEQMSLLEMKLRREKERANLLQAMKSKETRKTAIQTINLKIAALKVEISDLTYKIKGLEYRYPNLVPTK